MLVVNTSFVLYTGVTLLKSEVTKNTKPEEIKQKFIAMCVSFNIANLPVCTGIFDVFSVEVLPVLSMVKIGK